MLTAIVLLSLLASPRAAVMEGTTYTSYFY